MERFYAGENEEARLLSRHGQVEYRTTMRFIERYLQTGMRVADIGAGTGRYALALARQGCAVDAVELVESNLSRLRENARAERSIRVFARGARARPWRGCAPRQAGRRDFRRVLPDGRFHSGLWVYAGTCARIA